MFISPAYSPILAAQAGVPSSIVVGIILLLCLALLSAMRGGKVFWPIFYVLVAGVLLVCYPEALTAPIGLFDNVGVSPDAQVLCLLCTALLLTCTMASLMPLKRQGGHKQGYLATRSLWLGGLVAWVLICDTALLTVYLSTSYDYSGDNMLKSLNKHQAQVAGTVAFGEETELLDDDTLCTDEVAQAAAKQSRPIIPFKSTLLADTTYQPTAPALMLQLKSAEKPQKYVPRVVTSKQPGDPAKGNAGKGASQADIAELKRYIDKLEGRRYIQKRSLTQRRQMLPLLKEIANGADVNTQKGELEGWTALHYTCAIGDVNLTRWLLTHGANQNLKNKDGKTPGKCIGANHGDEIRDLLKKYNNK